MTKRKNGSGTAPRGRKGEDPEVTVFVCHAGVAAEVGLGGTFNDWKPIPMHKESEGRWEVGLPLPPGRYEFKFLVDGQWCCEPGCDGRNMDCPKCVINAHGTMNRVIEVT